MSQGTLLVNNSDKPIRWSIDCGANENTIMEEGVFKFLHPGGMPFLTTGDEMVSGELEPGQTYNLGIAFCPGNQQSPTEIIN